jgi:hypothetical protein
LRLAAGFHILKPAKILIFFDEMTNISFSLNDYLSKKHVGKLMITIQQNTLIITKAVSDSG